MTDYILSIDQGTTSSRALVFDTELRPAGSAQQELPQHFPQPGWVEHEPEEIWATVVATCRAAMREAGKDASSIAAIGLTNQRETVVAWDRATGKPLHRAIVWQDRRTAADCQALRQQGHQDLVARITGLELDPYFSASKIAWLMKQVPEARDLAKAGRLCIGTIDTFLIWRLTGGKSFLTDATNASRTMLYDIRRGVWSDEMLGLFEVPRSALPEVLDCAAEFGTADASILGAAIPIRGVAGDQQAATVGQACFEPGMMKSTYGTGCFAVLNVGDVPIASRHRLLSTIAYQLGGKPTYALEGSIFVAGAAVQWLRDGLRIVDAAAEVSDLAARADANQPVILVPAFVGLGAPYWDAECRGAIFGLTRGTGRAELARAALESVCFQTFDLMEAMRRDWGGPSSVVLRVDGGMVASDWMLQRLADILASLVDRPHFLETTAMGAAYLAGLQSGLCPPPAEFAKQWALDRRFTPAMAPALRAGKIAQWRDAVRRTLST